MAAAVGALALLGARGAAAQCYNGDNYVYDLCSGTTSGTTYDTKGALHGFLMSYGGHQYVISTLKAALTVFDVGNLAPGSLVPVTVATLPIPWDGSQLGADTHWPYVDHLQDISTLPGYPYAIASMYDFGWDYLYVSGAAARFLGTGYKPAAQLTSGNYISTALFSQAGTVYAAGQRLDSASIANGDNSIRIYALGSAANPGAPPSSATLGSGTRVPAGSAADGAYAGFPLQLGGNRLWAYYDPTSGHNLLFVRYLTGTGLLVVDMGDPASAPNPQPILWIPSDSTLFGGAWAFDSGHQTLWVADAAHPIIHPYQITTGSVLGLPTVKLSAGATFPYYGDGSATMQGTLLSVQGGLLVAGSGTRFGYLSLLGSGTPTPMASAVPYTDLSGRVCANSAYKETASGVTAFAVGTNYFVLRSLTVSADLVGINNACMSTTPVPGFTISGGGAASCSLATGGTPDFRGFPGDTFTILDQSGGSWTTGGQLDIQAPPGSTIGTTFGGSFPATITQGGTVSWPSSASTPPSDFTVVETIAGGSPSSATHTLSLCANPKASLTATVGGVQCANPSLGCGGLVGDTVVLGNTAQGHPAAAVGPSYYYQAAGDPAPTSGALTALAAKTTYTVGVVVPYAFAAANDPTCGNALFGTNVDTTVYHSCAIGTITAGFGTASFQVQQPAGVQVASGGTVLVDQPVTLVFTGRVAGGYTPTFAWTGIGGSASLQPSCAYSGAPSYTGTTCTLPAGSLTVGAQQSWGLTMTVCLGGTAGAGCATPADTVSSSPLFLVTPTQYSFTFHVTPANVNIGDTVSVILDTKVAPSGGFASLTFNLGGTTCDLVTQKTVTCLSIFGGDQCTTGSAILQYTYGASEAGRTDTITAFATYGTPAQNLNSLSQPTVQVSTTGACPCPTVTASVSGPSSAAVNQTVSFTASASSSGSAITGYAWSFGDGGSASGQSVSHAWSSSGLYPVRVTATNSCGKTGTGSASIQVGSGSGGNLTITPSPSNPDPGTQVTFTFSPAVRVSGDSISFNFGDGTSQLVAYSTFCQQIGGCVSVLHSFAQAGTYTVTASGTISGASVSGSTVVTVRNTCAATAVPAASFTSAPAAPKVGQAVSFTDTSTGTPTSWAWTFGGPGVSSTSIGIVHAAATGNLAITPNPATAAIGQNVIFTFSPALTAVGDSLNFIFGDGSTGRISYNASLCGSGCSAISHAYSAAGPFTVSASGTAGGASVSGTTSVTVSGGGGGSLTLSPSPANAAVAQTVTITFAPAPSQSGDTVTIGFGDGASQAVSYPACSTGGGCNVASHAYAAAGTYIVSGSGTAGGVSVAGNTTVVVSAGASSGSSTAQNPVYTFTSPGTYTVTLVATNCKGSNTTTQPVTILPLCDQSAPPTASFTWPTGPVDGFPEQQQPYAGQQITLTAASGASAGEPTSWHWYDFNELTENQTVATPAFTFVWPANLPTGTKNVRMTATNCFGTSAEVVNAVTIYPDVRHVVADFTWTTGTLATGAAITLVAAQGPSYGDPDQFTWTFDDGSPQQTGASITHTYTCAGTHTVRLAVGRSDYPAATASASHALTLTGTQCGPDSVMTVDAAQLSGLNNTSWLSNVRIFNPSTQTSQITVQFLPIGYNNSSPSGKTVSVGPNATLAIDNVIKWGQDNGVIGTDVKKAALRVLYSNPDFVPPILVSETYTSPTGGGTYGQLTPGIDVVPNTTPPTLWITGVRNSGTTTGFRTNYSLLNLRDTGVSSLVFTLLDPTGKAVASQSVNLGPYEYRQDSLVNLFGGAAAATSPNALAVKVAVPDGSDIQAYTSVVDNLTGDPVLIPAVPPPAAAIFLPAVAYTPGVNGTVWRSDMQLTNPDSAAHTWAVTYTPGGGGTLPIVTQKATIAAQSSVRYDDLLSWLYGGTLTDASKTSGVVEIAPDDGGSVYPIVQARSFNQTASGTFGQNIPPITPDMGVAAGQGERLLLTGMSSQDIARTNLGFVSLSDTSGVNFSVVFYDEGGNALNPKDDQGNPIPYTFALAHNGWDQDKLENRFHNAGWAALPAGLHAISAVIRVTDGGPGTVYATVIDNLTGDPNFILAQAAPQPAP